MSYRCWLKYPVLRTALPALEQPLCLSPVFEYLAAVMTQLTDAEIDNLRKLLDLAKAEDLGSGDVTSRMLPADAHAFGRFVARESLVVCGLPLLEEIARAYDSQIRTDLLASDGEQVEARQVLASWAGPARAILSAERAALNFFQRLSGIATVTRRFVDAVADTAAAIYDTRKTAPGWRRLEKYAIRCGGGVNHRMGLYDAVLVKDNHLAILVKHGAENPLAALAEQLTAARQSLGPEGFIEVEVDTLEQLKAALSLDVDVILLDNMSPADLRWAVEIRDEICSAAGERCGVKQARKVSLEASGGVTLENVREIAQTGIERIAVGALTHSAAAVDIGLDMQL